MLSAKQDLEGAVEEHTYWDNVEEEYSSLNAQGKWDNE